MSTYGNDINHVWENLITIPFNADGDSIVFYEFRWVESQANLFTLHMV